MQCSLGKPPNLLPILVRYRSKCGSLLGKNQRNFFWEGFSSSKLNHLVKWNLVSLPSKGGGLSLGGFKIHNSALLAKWGWRFAMEDSAF